MKYIQHPFSKIIFSLLLVILAIFLWQKNIVSPIDNITQNGKKATDLIQETSHCGLKIVKPEIDGRPIVSPLHIEAIIDNTKMETLGCSWGVFEAQAGTIQVTDTEGNILGTSTLNTVAEEWMTTSPTIYTSDIELSYIPDNKIILTFTEDNSADFPNPDTFSISIYTQ